MAMRMHGWVTPTYGQANGITFEQINSNQVAAPTASTAAVNATAGNLNSTYQYLVTYATSLGETEPGAYSNSVTPANQQVNLTAIPTSTDSRVTARKIYRTLAGNSPLLYGNGVFYLVTTISDNTTTTYTDNTADSGLGAAMPGYNSTGGTGFLNSTIRSIADKMTTAFGYGALASNGAFENTAFGVSALAANTTGQYNTAFGYQALQNNTTGFENTAIGQGAMRFATTAQYSTAIGDGALGSGNPNTGQYNTALGVGTLQFLTSGQHNIGIGYVTGGHLTSGSYNVLIGDSVVGASGATTASNNTAVGWAALDANTASDNVAVGYKAGFSLTTGGANVVLGYYADALPATSANALNIANYIFGAGLTGTGTSLAPNTAAIGIGILAPAHTLDVVGDIHASTNVITGTSAGAPATSPDDGALVVDTTDTRLYVRVGGAWHYATLT